MNEIKVSDRTKEEIAKFFLKTSVPRILEARRKEAEANDHRNDRDARTV